jgi:hypothetical protein
MCSTFVDDYYSVLIGTENLFKSVHCCLLPLLRTLRGEVSA